MITPLRDELALPLEPNRLPLRSWGYIKSVDDVRGETRLNGYVDGLDAARQMLHAIVHTERFTVPYLDIDDGVELEQFIGESFGYYLAKIENVLLAGILREDIFTRLEFLSHSQPLPNVAHTIMKVYTIYGSFTYGFDVPLAA